MSPTEHCTKLNCIYKTSPQRVFQTSEFWFSLDIQKEFDYPGRTIHQHCFIHHIVYFHSFGVSDQCCPWKSDWSGSTYPLVDACFGCRRIQVAIVLHAPRILVNREARTCVPIPLKPLGVDYCVDLRISSRPSCRGSSVDRLDYRNTNQFLTPCCVCTAVSSFHIFAKCSHSSALMFSFDKLVLK